MLSIADQLAACVSPQKRSWACPKFAPRRFRGMAGDIVRVMRDQKPRGIVQVADELGLQWQQIEAVFFSLIGMKVLELTEDGRAYRYIINADKSVSSD